MEIELPDEIEEIDTPGIDNMQAELLKADIEYATSKVKEIIDIVWRDEKTPRKWRKGLIVKCRRKEI